MYMMQLIKRRGDFAGEVIFELLFDVLELFLSIIMTPHSSKLIEGIQILQLKKEQNFFWFPPAEPSLSMCCPGFVF